MEPTLPAVTPQAKFKSGDKSRKRYIIPLVSLAILALGLLVGLLLVRQQQILRQKAAIEGGVAKIRIDPETKTVKVGDVFKANIFFDTSGREVSAINVVLTYDYSGSEAPFSVDSVQISNSLVNDNGWNFPSSKAEDNGNGSVRIEIRGFRTVTSGYKTDGEELLATLAFRAVKPGSITVRFDSNKSVMTEKSSANDILLIPSSSGVYTAVADGTATPTSTPAPTGTPRTTPTSTPAPAPTGKPRTTPTSTPTPTGTSGATSTPEGTSVSTSTPSAASTPPSLPESGISSPTLAGVVIAVVLLMASLALIF